MNEIDLCAIVRKIHENPAAPVEITVRNYQRLQEHLNECPECRRLVDEVLEKYKDIAPGSKGWDQADLN